ncbi:MAG TPA: outer membrane protein assembly factor BamB [Burkholderiales bacterium]|nr:outer membrane protein assembly factor BamB [Burkholderiales bacterium]
MASRGALALAAALVAGCASAPSGPKPAELTPLEHPGAVRRLWTAQVGDAGRFVFEPAFADGAVYAAARDGTVVRLDAASGRETWRASAGVPLSAGVGSDGRVVAVATEEGVVAALEAASGKPLWRARVSSEVLAAPAVADGLVVVRSLDNRVFAFDAKDGKRRWVYQRAPTSLIVRVPSGVVLDGESAYAGFRGGKLAAIALSNGGQRWEATVALPKGATELERVTDVVGEPALEGREICAAAYQGKVACFEAASGRTLWSREVSSLTGVSTDPRYAFVADDSGAVQALDRSSGRSVWKQDKLLHRGLSLPVPVGELVAVGDFEGYVHFLARETGAFAARYATGGGAVQAAPLRLPFGVLVQTQKGELHAIAP